MHFRMIGQFGALALLVALLAGCASVAPEKLAKMATVEVADGFTMHSVDSEVKLFTNSVNVEPGVHLFEMTIYCHNNNCSHRAYRFKAEAGYLYRLMPNNSILVLDRNDRFQRKLDELTPIGGIDYGTRNQVRTIAQEAARQREAAQAALIERRRQNLPQVMKQGAQVCRLQGQLLYVGFVEAFTDQKIQIRVADAVVNENRNVHLTDFTPSIVWDSPLNWDMCE
jgi:hypothetical protein